MTLWICSLLLFNTSNGKYQKLRILFCIASCTRLVTIICYRCTLLNRKKHTALSALSIRFTRSPSTKRDVTPPPLRVSAATTPSKRASVARPSQSSARRQRLPRRLPWSLSAPPASIVAARSLADANHSFLERKKTSRDKFFSDRQTHLLQLHDASRAAWRAHRYWDGFLVSRPPRQQLWPVVFPAKWLPLKSQDTTDAQCPKTIVSCSVWRGGVTEFPIALFRCPVRFFTPKNFSSFSAFNVYIITMKASTPFIFFHKNQLNSHLSSTFISQNTL